MDLYRGKIEIKRPQKRSQWEVTVETLRVAVPFTFPV